MQVTRQHIQLVAVPNDSANGEMSGREEQSQQKDAQPRSARGHSGFVANGFEHRHRAQQQLLEQQQQQLREQRRLIEEMQALQRQQLLQQQHVAGEQRQQQQQLPSSDGQSEPSRLHGAVPGAVPSIPHDVLQQASNTDRTTEQMSRLLPPPRRLCFCLCMPDAFPLYVFPSVL